MMVPFASPDVVGEGANHYTRGRVCSPTASGTCGGFTMVEIAICLAVIGFALVAIIGVLPIGMNVQKDNREETVINFDANYLMNAIRSGAQDTFTTGPQSLTNFVIAITNKATLYSAAGGRSHGTFTYWYTASNYCIDGSSIVQSPALINNAVIISLLTKPKYALFNNPAGSYYSNYITADIRAITGSPMDQGTSQISKDFAFTYRVAVEIVPSAAFPYAYYDGTFENFTAPNFTTNNSSILPGNTAVPRNLQLNLNEIRLRFNWPVLPGGRLGTGNQVYRTCASGALEPVNLNGPLVNRTVTPTIPHEFSIASQYYTIAP